MGQGAVAALRNNVKGGAVFERIKNVGDVRMTKLKQLSKLSLGGRLDLLIRPKGLHDLYY